MEFGSGFMLFATLKCCKNESERMPRLYTLAVHFLAGRGV